MSNTPLIDAAIAQLMEALRQEASPHATYVEIGISGREYRIDITYRTPEQLRAEGISMRNLRGEFIK